MHKSSHKHKAEMHKKEHDKALKNVSHHSKMMHHHHKEHHKMVHHKKK